MVYDPRDPGWSPYPEGSEADKNHRLDAIARHDAQEAWDAMSARLDQNVADSWAQYKNSRNARAGRRVQHEPHESIAVVTMLGALAGGGYLAYHQDWPMAVGLVVAVWTFWATTQNWWRTPTGAALAHVINYTAVLSGLTLFVWWINEPAALTFPMAAMVVGAMFVAVAVTRAVFMRLIAIPAVVTAAVWLWRLVVAVGIAYVAWMIYQRMA